MKCQCGKEMELKDHEYTECSDYGFDWERWHCKCGIVYTSSRCAQCDYTIDDWWQRRPEDDNKW